ncbi:MAG: UMP kinase, partial [Planctomycetota bacterium]
MTATPESNSSSDLRYKRVVLKLSGESLAADGGRGISGDEVEKIARQIVAAKETGCEIAVVIGGGNILRGAQFSDSAGFVQQATAHYMGMIVAIIP